MAAVPTQAKRTDRRVIRTRKAIMDAFDRLVVADRGEKITVSAIAREADIDRKTFYLHYASIDDLANSKAEAGMERILGVVLEEGMGASPRALLHRGLQEVNAILVEDLDVCAHIAERLSTDQILERFELTLPLAIERTGIPIDKALAADQDLHMRLQFFVAGALSLYSAWLKSERDTPIEMVSSIIEEAAALPD